MSGRSDREVVKGVLDAVVLHALARGDNYGFGLLQEIRQRVQGEEQSLLKEQSVYPLLHRLESRGLLESYHRPGQRGTPRKFYRVTDAGRALLDERTEQWRRVVALLNETVLLPASLTP